MGVVKLFLLLAVIALESVDCNCSPKNWKYAWTKVGDAWFTEIPTADNWHNQLLACKNIEPRRTSMAKVLTKAEQTHILSRFRPRFWIGGVEIAGHYYWFDGPTKMSDKLWQPLEPSDRDCKRHCVQYYTKRGYDDTDCAIKQRALCELRC